MERLSPVVYTPYLARARVAELCLKLTEHFVRLRNHPHIVKLLFQLGLPVEDLVRRWSLLMLIDIGAATLVSIA